MVSVATDTGANNKTCELAEGSREKARVFALWQQGSTQLLVGGAWTATSNALQNSRVNLWSELGSLVPGVNTVLKLVPAVQACF